MADGAVLPLRGRVRVPGDKSISHRLLLLGALAGGRTTGRGLNTGEDVRATVACLRALGIEVAFDAERATAEVEGAGPGWPGEPAGVLECGNSGTTMRLLLGICAAIDGLSVLSGDASLRRRPMARVVEPLRAMGARIDGRAGGERAPLAVRGGPLRAVRHASPVASAQVKSALLLAGLAAEGVTEVTEPAPSRDHTERLLAAAGVEVVAEPGRAAVRGPARPRPLDLDVPGDLSSALYLIAAALVVPGSVLTVEHVGLNPTRTAVLDVLQAMGAELEVVRAGEAAGEPYGAVTARSSALRAVDLGPAEVPLVIDELPLLAVLCALAEGRSEVRGAAELRVKESDRIATMVGNLRALGAEARELPDGYVIEGPARLTGGEVASHGDHRVALACAVAGLAAAGRVTVSGWRVAETSFPGFLDVLAEAQGRAATRGER